VIESNQGQDLNGDGVLGATVWHAIDPDGSVTNLGVGFTTFPPPPPVLSSSDFLDPSFLPLLVQELTSDLNGDGDQEDLVLHHWLHRSSTLENQAVAADSIYDASLARGGVRVTFVEVGETDVDLNADGDLSDEFLAVTRGPGQLQVVPLALAKDVANPFDESVFVRALVAAFVVGEPEHGSDLNGDGDVVDKLLYVLDGVTGDVTALQWEVQPNEVVVASERVFALRPEVPGSDWNGDGDTSDRVLFGYDPSTGQTTNYALALFSVPLEFAASSDGDLFVGVSEASQGGTDLNGDGDAFDIVAHVVRPER